MVISTLQSICFDVILQQFYNYQNGGTSKCLLNELEKGRIIDLFLDGIFTRLVDRYPLIVCDDIINLLCHPNLKTVSLKGCKNVSAHGLNTIIERCSKLVSVDLSECDHLVSANLSKILIKGAKNLRILKLDSCDTLSDNTFKDIWNFDLDVLSNTNYIQHHPSLVLTKAVRINLFAHHLTTVNVSGCRNISSSFVRYLMSVARSNLQSINISWTNIDCMALVYLSGYTLSSAVHIAVNNDTMTPVPYLEELIEQARVYEFQNECVEQLDTANLAEEQSASVYLKQLCAYCTQDLALRKYSASTFDMFSESYEDYEIIDSQVVKLFKNQNYFAKNFLESSNNTASLDWDVLSVNDCNVSLRVDVCTCTSPSNLSSPGSDSPSTDTECKVLLKSDKSEDDYRQLFIPNITSVDITQIDFYDFEIGKKCLELFAKSNPKLNEFHTSWEEVYDYVLSSVVSNCCDIQNLSLVDCERISNDGIFELAKHCKKLKAIDLKGVAFVYDAALLNLIDNNIELQSLYFAESALTDVVLQRISKNLNRTLKQLDLSWCENITDKGVIQLLSSCTELSSLDLRQCEVTADTVKALAKYGGNLTSLGLCGIKGLNDASCQEMVKSMPHLRTVDFSWNSSLVDDSISTLFLSCPCLREVTIAGLKRITSKPFLPIISDYGIWRRRRESICSKLQRKFGGSTRSRQKDISDYEILHPDFYMPFRSCNYVPHLQKLTLGYCDKLNDIHLAEIVAVCRGTLLIEDYYGEAIKPKWSDSPRTKIN